MARKIVLLEENQPAGRFIVARAEGFGADTEILRFTNRQELYNWLNRLLFSEAK